MPVPPSFKNALWNGDSKRHSAALYIGISTFLFLSDTQLLVA